MSEKLLCLPYSVVICSRISFKISQFTFKRKATMPAKGLKGLHTVYVHILLHTSN